MKNLKFFTLAIAILGLTATSFAQNTSSSATTTASASAYILKHIEITKDVDLSFGGIIADGAAISDVKVFADGTATTYGTAKVSAITGTAGTVKPATFTVKGETGSTFAVTLPADGVVTIKETVTNQTMDVKGFTTNLTDAAAATLTAGTNTFNVGATLVVGANQTAGNYTGSFSVTVNYN